MPEAIVLELPDQSYRRVQRLAAAMRADVGTVLLNAIERGLPDETEAAALDELAMLTDGELEARAAASFDRAKLAAFRRLRRKQEEQALSPGERQQLESLLDDYERAQLEKARATAMLALRRRTATERA